MGWKGVTTMDQKVRFISDYLERLYPISELCHQFGISRKTGYKWIGRYREYGVEGLEDRSRKPLSCPHQTDDEIVTRDHKRTKEATDLGAKEAPSPSREETS